MTATMEAPPIVDERIGAVRPTDAARLAEIVLVLARNGVVTVTRRGGALVLRPQRQAPLIRAFEQPATQPLALGEP